MSTLNELPLQERKQFIAKLNFAVEKRSHLYWIAQAIVEDAEKQGVFTNVKFFTDGKEEIIPDTLGTDTGF